MPFFDLPLEALQQYRPALTPPHDFDAFWQQTLAETRQIPLEATFTAVDYGLTLIESYDVTFKGYDGQMIRGWLLLPKVREEPLPCIVEYVGYGGGRGTPLDWLTWPNLGFATLVMDTRGQGSGWLPGNTPDFEPDGSSPQYPGFMTRGILSPDMYYYRRLMTDAVRAVEAARAHPAIAAEQIIAAGHSQGGGLSLAVAGLVTAIGMAAGMGILVHLLVMTGTPGRRAAALACRRAVLGEPIPNVVN